VERLEYRFETRCIEELRRLPKSYWPDKSPSAAVRGLADRAGCINGHYIALEFKRSKSAKRAELQNYNLIKIRQAKGFAFFVYPENWDEVYSKLKELAHEN
jgi:hypothetical protein